MKNILIVFLAAFFQSSIAQSTFAYDVVLTPVSVSGLPGLHSYAFAQHNGKWLIIGGRKDGVHAGQPLMLFQERKIIRICMLLILQRSNLGRLP